MKTKSSIILINLFYFIYKVILHLFLLGLCVAICLFGLFEFYGISTIIGYLMLNPVFTYILNT